MGLFGGNKKPLIGIDIGSNAVRVVELERAGGRFRVSRYAVKSMPRKAIHEHTIVDVEQVSKTIAGVVKRSGSRRKHAAIAIPGAHVLSKTIGMPRGMSDEELERQIEFESDHYIPYPLEEVNLDFNVRGSTKDSPEEDDVLITACRRVVMDDYISAVETANMEPVVVDVDIFAAETAYELIAEQQSDHGAGKSVAVINVGAHNMHINILNGGCSVYSRYHAFGSNRLTQQIQKRFGFGFTEAERAKRSGNLPENYTKDILHPFMESMCQEVRRALQFYYSSSGREEVDQILLTGGGVILPHIDELMTSRVGLPTSIANPFSAMTYGPRINEKKFSNTTPTLFTACGLAMRNFD